MKHATSILILIILVYSYGYSQTGVSTAGVSMQGIRGDEYQAEKAAGLLAVWRANQGVIFSTGTNVQVWQDISGNNLNLPLKNYNSNGTAPVFVSSYTTNGFPAIVFDGSLGNQLRLRCDDLAAYATASQPITMIACYCAQTNNVVHLCGFGWTSATNTNASILSMRPNAGTTTTKAMVLAFNTNSTAQTYIRSNVNDTNIYSIMTISWDGTANARVYENFKQTSTAIPNPGVITLNTFIVGGLIRTNANFVQPWYGGITELQFYTNFLSSTSVSNATLNINKRFPCL